MLKQRIRDMMYRLRGEVSTERLAEQGMKVGERFERMNNVLIDDSHAWLIEIGDDVTLAPRVHILAHDASTKKFLGYTRIGRVTIGSRVFVGAESVILPGVTIGSDVIIGANSTVTHDISDNSVAVGSPARVICTLDEFLDKERAQMARSPVYDASYTLREQVPMDKRMQQKKDLEHTKGYIV